MPPTLFAAPLRLLRGAPLAGLLILAACNDPNAALNERVAKAEAAAKRAEDAALKAEKAVAKLDQAAKPEPAMVDGGPQLTPEPMPPQPQLQPQSAGDDNAEAAPQ